MRFLMTYTSHDTTPPSPEKTAERGRFGEDMIRSGVLVAAALAAQAAPR